MTESRPGEGKLADLVSALQLGSEIAMNDMTSRFHSECWAWFQASIICNVTTFRSKSGIQRAAISSKVSYQWDSPRILTQKRLLEAVRNNVCKAPNSRRARARMYHYILYHPVYRCDIVRRILNILSDPFANPTCFYFCNSLFLALISNQAPTP